MTQEKYQVFYPLSYGQRALWFLSKTAPQSVAYNTFMTVQIRSKLDIESLRAAWEKIFERHPILRTTYTTYQGEPVQQIHQQQKVYIQVTDAENWSEDYLKEQIFIEADRPFDLEQGPILRLNLFNRTPKEHFLLIAMHHIAGDVWSFDVLLNELQVLYADKTEDSLPKSQPYTEYVLWQSEKLSSSRGEALWQYWQQKLAGSLPILNLPTDRPRPPVQTYNGASYTFKLDEKITAALHSLAKAEGVTLYTVLLSVFQVLLYRHSGQEDILVGTPIAGREEDKFSETVGYFANPVVLRSNLSRNPTFKELLAQNLAIVFEAIVLQDYPFPLLVERLQSQRDPSRSPLFQVSLIWQEQRWCKPNKKLLSTQDKKLQMEPYLLGQRGAGVDLNVYLSPIGEIIQVCWQYNTDLFDATTMVRMSGHFQTLLESILTNPEQQTSELPLLTKAERHQLLVEWNNTQADYPQDKCFHQWFEAQVEQTPDAVAVVFEEQQLTYGELNYRTNQLAHYLRTLGVGSEVLVGICVERSIEMVVGILGIFKAGGAYVPLDPAYPLDRLSDMLSDSQVSVLLTTKKSADQLPAHQGLTVYLDTDWEKISQQSQQNPTTNVYPNNLAYIIYTSGSTGKPKGVLVEHKGLSNLSKFQQILFDVQPNSRILQFFSFSFDASLWEIVMALGAGATLVLARKEFLLPSSDLIQLLRDAGITTVAFPASVLKQLPVEELPLLQIIVVTAEACSADLVECWAPGRRFFNGYGPTETTVGATIAELTDGSKPVTIGRPFANTQIYILDRHLQPVPVRVPGELYVGGIGVARGYLNRPDLTDEKFIPNPFSNQPKARLYKTGDLARYLSDGNIEFLGRIDNQVKVRGFRIELGEIEAVLAQHPQVRETAVIAREDIPGDKRLVAYVVLNQKPFTISNLRSFLKTKLPDYMMPSAFVLLEAMPLNPNGKIDRRALPAPDNSSFESETSFVAPRDSLELQLAQIWSEVLGVYPVGVQDNFFTLGGHSLLAVRLMTQIEQQFGKNLSLAALFQGATIEQLAIFVRQQTDSSSWSPLVAIQPHGSKPPFFCMPGLGGNVVYFQELARHLGNDQPFYALQARGLDGVSQPFTRVEDIATHYIEAIQMVQQEGPYLLGGYSFGAIVAYEMAQQLLHQAQEVALLVVLDRVAPFPGTNLKQLDWDDAKLWNATAYMLEKLSGKNLGISYEVLQPLTALSQLNYVKQQLETVHLLPPGSGIEKLRGIMQTIKADLLACLRYVPQGGYRGRITLLRTSEVYRDELGMFDEIPNDSTLGWNQLSTEPVDVHSVPGNHFTMLTQPYVKVLAENLKICLGR
jgi:surfactin family lipopeptide synthetase A